MLLCGREFTVLELQNIQETVRMFPLLSQRELGLTICENLNWIAPNGRYKIDACRQLLIKLEAQGALRLPDLRKTLPGKNTVIPSVRTDARDSFVGTLSQFEPIHLEAVRKIEDVRLWNEYVMRYHVLGYKRPFGAHQRYFIVSQTGSEYHRVGCLLFAASAWALAERDNWIGWSQGDRSQRLHLVVNNTRFLIFPWIKIKNLASKVLSMAVKQIGYDWQERYGYKPVLLETFVDSAKYRGTCYKAANWMFIGETVGRGRMDRNTQYLSSPKKIFVYPLVKDFRGKLRVKSGQGDSSDA
ncbi:hypothetical protein JT05_07120 [Desulfosporosinus sp. Tol-M]|nr:hypothetical protein JT05_07120 [Desulfosporosinus sp. Tol-M]